MPPDSGSGLFIELMANTILVGAQWGDEGKGKIIDVLTEEADVVVRTQGGNNAGHTVHIKGQKYILHLVPSGILRKNKVCVIGNGVVVDPVSLVQEIEGLRKLGIRIDKNPTSARRPTWSFPIIANWMPSARPSRERTRSARPSAASARPTATRRRGRACV